METTHTKQRLYSYHKVGLQSVVDEGFAGVVSLRQEVEGKVLYGLLKVGLFCVNQYAHSMALSTLKGSKEGVSNSAKETSIED